MANWLNMLNRRKIKNQTIILFLVLANAFVACNEDEDLFMKEADMWNCHHEKTWDESSTTAALVGVWDWEYGGCYEGPADDKKFEGLTIEFKPDNTLEVMENGQTTQTSNWQVVDGDVHLFALDVDPRVNQLRGRILLCGDRVEFNNSYKDGCDNYFKRKR